MTGPARMVDAIQLRTQERSDGVSYDVARLWVGGVPFSADLSPDVERTTRRLAAELDLDVDDLRQADPARGKELG